MQFASCRPLFFAGFMLSLGLIVSNAAPAQTISQFLKQPPTKEDPVIARVGTTTLKRSDFLRSLDGFPPQIQQMSIEAVYPLILDRLIDNKIITSTARAHKLNEDAEVKQRLADYENRLLQEIYLNRAVAAKIDEKFLQERYQQFLKENPPQEEIHARHILVASETTAKEIIADLKKGGDFTAIASAKSTDGTANSGGDLGFFTRENMVPEFSDAAFALKVGEFTQNPVKSQFGWHVIKLEQRRASATPTFGDLKEQLTSEISQELIAKLVEDLRKKEKIEKFDLDGKPLPASE